MRGFGPIPAATGAVPCPDGRPAFSFIGCQQRATRRLGITAGERPAPQGRRTDRGRVSLMIVTKKEQAAGPRPRTCAGCGARHLDEEPLADLLTELACRGGRHGYERGKAAGRNATNGCVWMNRRTRASSRRSPQPRILLNSRSRYGCARRNRVATSNASSSLKNRCSGVNDSRPSCTFTLGLRAGCGPSRSPGPGRTDDRFATGRA